MLIFSTDLFGNVKAWGIQAKGGSSGETFRFNSAPFGDFGSFESGFINFGATLHTNGKSGKIGGFHLGYVYIYKLDSFYSHELLDIYIAIESHVLDEGSEVDSFGVKTDAEKYDEAGGWTLGIDKINGWWTWGISITQINENEINPEGPFNDEDLLYADFYIGLNFLFISK